MRYTIKHTLATDVDTFWDKLFFDAEFNRALYIDGLGFTTYEVAEERKEPSGVVHRRVICLPKVQLPAAARRVLGDNTGYTEIGRFDPVKRRYQVEVHTNVASDKIKTSCEVYVEPHGEKRCERIANIDMSVKLFGLGTLIEGFFEQQTRDLYGRAADFTNRWIKDHGL